MRAACTTLFLFVGGARTYVCVRLHPRTKRKLYRGDRGKRRDADMVGHGWAHRNHVKIVHTVALSSRVHASVAKLFIDPWLCGFSFCGSTADAGGADKS